MSVLAAVVVMFGSTKLPEAVDDKGRARPRTLATILRAEVREIDEPRTHQGCSATDSPGELPRRRRRPDRTT